MKLDKILKWLGDQEVAIYDYKHTSRSVADIARFLKISEGTAANMIMNKKPKSVRKFLGEES